MSPLPIKSIFDRLDISPLRGANPVRAIVPVDEHVQFIRMVDECVQSTLQESCPELNCIVDSHTAQNCVRLKDLLPLLVNVVMVGDYPPAWSSDDKVTVLPRGAQLAPKDHFFILMCGTLQVAILATADMEQQDRAGAFYGGWTIHPDYAEAAVQLILAGDAQRYLQPLQAGEAVSGSMSTTAIALMALQSGDLGKLREDQALDRADLFSVLHILKAISSRRRAHDVLYVFVEQIARVIASDRCSIVRIWGRANESTVLASHEDATLSDHRIALERYPELMEALERRETVVIQDVRNHPLMESCREQLQQVGVKSVLVIPIVLFDDEVGTLLLRAARKEGTFTLREMSFFEIVSEAACNALERAHLLDSVQAANERLEHIARTDGLTGLFNRRYFHEQFTQEFERARRYENPLSCMIFDVDDFKKVNDTFGHLVGDSVLIEIANRMQRRVRSIDLSARYGGEEFVVLMPQTEAEGALAQAERLRKYIADNPFDGVPNDAVISVSIGVAVYDHDNMKSPADLLRAADHALYKAKQDGKNRVAVAEVSNP